MINKIKVRTHGYVCCKSGFYTAQSIIPASDWYNFDRGINEVHTEIDSPIWALSYLLSMYNHKPEDFIMFEFPKVICDDLETTLDEVSLYSCYMDKLYPLYSVKYTIKELVENAIQNNKSDYSTEYIRNLFCIDCERFNRQITGVGNEIFKAMAAIGYVNQKQIYCFPWLSQMRFDGYHRNLTGLLDILKDLNMIVILPVGK